MPLQHKAKTIGVQTLPCWDCGPQPGALPAPPHMPGRAASIFAAVLGYDRNSVMAGYMIKLIVSIRKLFCRWSSAEECLMSVAD